MQRADATQPIIPRRVSVRPASMTRVVASAVHGRAMCLAAALVGGLAACLGMAACEGGSAGTPSAPPAAPAQVASATPSASTATATPGAPSSQAATPSAPASAQPATAAAPVAELGPVHKLSVVDLDGNNVSLAKFAGRPMIIEIWATWCGPCRANRRTVHGLKSGGQLPERLAVIGVSMDTGPSLVKNFLQSNEANEAEYMASSEFNEFIRTINASPSIPKTLYVDSKGRVADLAEGVQSQNWLKAMARNLR